MAYRECLSAVFGLLLLALLPAAGRATDDAPPHDAVGYLKAIEKVRTSAKPFTLTAAVTDKWGPGTFVYKYRVECEGDKYRIVALNTLGVAIFDGNAVLSYDGRGSAIITSRSDTNENSLAFDPRALGLSTGLRAYLPLEMNIPYRDAADITFAEIPEERRREGLVAVTLTDRFDQRIRFEFERTAPYRMRYYSKTIFKEDGSGVASIYTTESEYSPDDTSWMPTKLTMCTLFDGLDGDRIIESVAEFGRPEFVEGFDPGNWGRSGLNLPTDQRLVDLRRK